MGQTISTIPLNIVDTLPANTDLEPLSENGFVWIFCSSVPSIPGNINSQIPLWIKFKIDDLVSLPVYSDGGLVSLQTKPDPNGLNVGVYYKSSGITITIEQAFEASLNNGILTVVSIGVLPPAGKNSQELYVQHSTLAPQVPQVSTSDLLAEIIQRQTNPQDTRKLPENVTITVGQQTIINNNLSCDKKCKDHYCKKCNHKH